MNNLTLFIVGTVVTIPSALVVGALVFAAGIDERAEKKRLSQREGEVMAGALVAKEE